MGVIGRSGSGKSSLQKLIVNLYQPNTGNILIDGVDARQLDVSDLRHNIGYVPQDIQLFSGSLRNNLISGARYVEDEAMLRAAEISGVNEFARLHRMAITFRLANAASSSPADNVKLSR